MTVVNPFDFFVEPYAFSFPFAYTNDLKTELAPYLATSEQGPLFAAYLKEIPREADSTVNFLVELNAQLQKKVSYVIRMEPGIQTPEETLARGSGSCRDSAWLLIHLLRHLGLAARFVSGYLMQLRPDIDPVEGPREVESDFTDLHAWAEVYLPGAGWIGFDVTSGMLTGEGHIPVAATPHYGQGKWYPGESLPRWAFGLYWRKDGIPIWNNANLIAKIENPAQAAIADAARLTEGTAKRLGLRPDYVMPAYEDPLHWIERE